MKRPRVTDDKTYHWIRRPHENRRLSICWFRAPDGHIILVIAKGKFALPIRLPKFR